MEEELLKELDSILNPAIRRAWDGANRHNLSGGDPRTMFLHRLEVEIDHTKVDLSKIMYKLDHAAHGRRTDVERAESEFFDSFTNLEEQELPEVDTNDYVREINDGFEVWDGIRWVPLSKKADIKVEVFENPENNSRPAVKVWARDESTQTSVVFVDNDIHAPGWDSGYMIQGDGFDEHQDFVPRNAYWQDPFYRMPKNAVGFGGRAAGALAMRHLGNFTPGLTGENLKFADGWFRIAEGKYNRLSQQRGFATGAGGNQVSAQKALSKAKPLRNFGRICFMASTTMSAYDSFDAYSNNDANWEEVAVKASLDIIIGFIGVFGGPTGWAISATYLISQMKGDWGTFGQPVGMTRPQLSAYNRSRTAPILHNMGRDRTDRDFEVDYIPSIEETEQQMLWEERLVRRDNTNVKAVKTIFSRSLY